MNNTSFTREVKQFETHKGAKVFQIPLPEFPNLWGYAYLALVNDKEHGFMRVLIDTGSGFGDSNLYLEAGLREVSKQAGQEVNFSNLTHILITHGHIDHIGGLTYIRPQTEARVGVHELDLRNLTNFDERVTIISCRLEEYLMEAGVSADTCTELVTMYKLAKSLYRSVKVDFTYEAIGMRLGPFEMLHVPGHCAGHVVIRLHDFLFCGDHVLSDISPHQSPEQLTSNTGLGHYLMSLQAMLNWADGVRLTLGGHNEPIYDFVSRIHQIQSVHKQRLQQVLEMLKEPHTVADVSYKLFGEVNGYNKLLALEEAGAHVEYLYQRGLLGIENLEEWGNGCKAAAIRYQRLPHEKDD